MEPKFFITIENASGVPYGKGDLKALTRWDSYTRLDRAGEFSFEVHSSDEMCEHLEEKRYVRCWYIQNGVLKSDRGIIDLIETDVDSGLITVSGGDMLRELANTTVGTLYLHTDVEYMPSYVGYTHYDTAEPYETALTNSYDGVWPGNLFTAETLHIHTQGDLDWLYVDYSKAFIGCTFVLNGTVNTTASVLTGQYYTSDEGWVDLEGFVDNTAVAGVCFAQAGEASWNMPLGWEKYTTGGGDVYRIRFRVSATTDDFQLHSVYVRVEEPTAAALSTIVALASGWSVDDTAGDPPYAETASSLTAQFENDSILAALVWLTEHTQPAEHFRYSSDRKIYWLRDDTPSSGIIAVKGGPDNNDLDLNAGVCIIKDLQETKDSYDLITRIYPYGAGLGNAKLNLVNTTQSAPAGYSLSLSGDDSYISNDTAEATYGVISKRLVWKEITPRDSSADAAIQAADDLFKRALTHLQRYSQVVKQYRLSVVGLKTTLYPGQTIRVIYDEWVGSYHSINIDDDLIILEVHNQMDADGIRTVGLTVSTIDAWAMSQEEQLFANIQQSTSLSTVTQMIPAESISTANVGPGLLLMTTSNGAAFRQVDTKGFPVLLGYLPLAGGTMTGVATLVNSQAQGNALITPINSANGQIDWARVAKTGSNLTDLATRNYADLNSRAHVITSADHTVTGAALDIVGLSTTNTLGVLTPSADVMTSPVSAILKSDASGFLSLAKLTTPTLTAAADLTISPVGDVVFNPTGNDILPTNNYDLNLGSLTKKYLTLHAAELWVETLVAQNTIATIGGRVLVGPTTTLVEDLASGDTHIHVKHNELASGDRVYMEANGQVEFMAITSGASGSAGNYSYNVTRNLDGSGANDWAAGDAVFNTGTTGDGWIDLYSVGGIGGVGIGPTIVGNVRTGTDYGDWAARWAIGNLNGLYGVGANNIYGVGIGEYASNNYLRYTADATGFVLKAGAGSCTIDATGITLDSPASYAASAALKYINSGNTYGAIYGYVSGSTHWLVSESLSIGTDISVNRVKAVGPSGVGSMVELIAAKTGSTDASLTIQNTTGTAEVAITGALLVVSTGRATSGFQIIKNFDGSSAARPDQIFMQGVANDNLKAYFGFDTTNKCIIIQAVEDTVAWLPILLGRDGAGSCVGIGLSSVQGKLDVGGAVSLRATSDPGAGVGDSVFLYVTATGTTPNHRVEAWLKFDDGTAISLGSTTY